MSFKLGFLFQGECKSGTLNFLHELYTTLNKTLHDFLIVVSCWSDDEYLKHISKILTLMDTSKIKVVVNDKPVIKGARNINLQSQSCVFGMNEMESFLGDDDLVVKCRLDQAFAIDILLDYVNRFRISEKKFLALDLFTRRRIPFHLGDMILCMPFSSHKTYWRPESFSSEFEYLQWLNGRECSITRLTDIDYTKCIPEVRLLTEYLMQKGQISFSLSDWYLFMEQNVFLMSSEKLFLFSFKTHSFYNKSMIMASVYFSPLKFRASPLIVECVEEGERLFEISLSSVIFLNYLLFFPYFFLGTVRLVARLIFRFLKLIMETLIRFESS